MLNLLLLGSVAVVSLMLVLWWLGVRTNNFSYVDLGWSANFIVLGLIYGIWGDGDVVRRVLICSMYGLWSLRLTLHLAVRIIGEPEEGRYVQLRTEWGRAGYLNLKFLGFFQFQAVLNILLGVPMLLAAMNASSGLHAIEGIGAAIWAMALVGETVADVQLKNFKQDEKNRGKVCNTGLWGWSRHPNYFFEWLIWIGYALFAFASPWGWVTMALPVLMLHFLLNVTGVKATEEQAVRTKGDAYRQYQRDVSAFVPLPPKT